MKKIFNFFTSGIICIALSLCFIGNSSHGSKAQAVPLPSNLTPLNITEATTEDIEQYNLFTRYDYAYLNSIEIAMKLYKNTIVEVSEVPTQNNENYTMNFLENSVIKETLTLDSLNYDKYRLTFKMVKHVMTGFTSYEWHLQSFVKKSDISVGTTTFSSIFKNTTTETTAYEIAIPYSNASVLKNYLNNTYIIPDFPFYIGDENTTSSDMISAIKNNILSYGGIIYNNPFTVNTVANYTYSCSGTTNTNYNVYIYGNKVGEYNINKNNYIVGSKCYIQPEGSLSVNYQYYSLDFKSLDKDIQRNIWNKLTLQNLTDRENYSELLFSIIQQENDNSYIKGTINIDLNVNFVFEGGLNYEFNSFMYRWWTYNDNVLDTTEHVSSLNDIYFSNYTFVLDDSSNNPNNIKAFTNKTLKLVDNRINFNWDSAIEGMKKRRLEYEFNLSLATDEVISQFIGSKYNDVEYKDCKWYDLTCHLSNAYTYLVYDLPIVSDISSFAMKLKDVFIDIYESFEPLYAVPFISGIVILSLGFHIIKKGCE